MAPPFLWAVSSSAGQLFQSKKSFLISIPNLPWHNLRWFLPVLRLVNWEIDWHLSSLLRVYLTPPIQMMDKNTKETWPQYWALETLLVTSPDWIYLHSPAHLCDGTQDELLRELPWHQGQADRSGHPLILSGHSCRWVPQSYMYPIASKKPKRFACAPRSGQRHSKVLAAQAHFTGVPGP